MKRLFQITLTIGMTLIGLLLLWQFRPTLILFVASLTLTAVLRPMVGRMEQRGMQRSLAILLLYVGIIVFFLAIAATVVLYLQATLELSIVRVSEGYERTVNNLLAGSPFQQRLSRAVPNPSKWVDLIFAGPNEGEGVDFFGILGMIGGEFVFLLAVLALAFYWLMEVSRFERLLLSFLPASARLKTHVLWQNIEATVGAYVRNITVTIFIAAALLFPINVAVGLPFAMTLAIVGGLSHLVPRIGPILGLLPALMFGLFVSPTTALLALVGGGIAQYIAHLISMRALRMTRVNVNPLLQVILLMALVQLAGIWGMLLAPPLAAMVQEVFPLLVSRPAPQAVQNQELHELETELETLSGEVSADDRQLTGAVKRSGELIAQAREAIAQPQQ